MSRIFFIVLLNALVLNSFSQVEIQIISYDDLYSGIYNTIVIVTDEYKCSELEVNTSQGELISIDNCMYELRYIHVGEVEISVTYKDSLLKKESFFSNELPKPIVLLDNLHSNGNISLEEIKKANGLTAVFKLGDIEMNFISPEEIISFKAIICTEGGLKVVKNKGTLFNEEILRTIDSAVLGQQFFFDDIRLKRNTHYRWGIYALNYMISGCQTDYDMNEFQCSCDCGYFHTDLHEMGWDTIQYGEVCIGDTVSHFVEITTDNTMTRENKLTNEFESFITSDKSDDVKYVKSQEMDTLVIGQFKNVVDYIDSLWQISMITLQDTLIEIPTYKKIEQGVWSYYNKQRELIRREEYEMGEMIKEEEF